MSCFRFRYRYSISSNVFTCKLKHAERDKKKNVQEEDCTRRDGESGCARARARQTNEYCERPAAPCNVFYDFSFRVMRHRDDIYDRPRDHNNILFPRDGTNAAVWVHLGHARGPKCKMFSNYARLFRCNAPFRTNCRTGRRSSSARQRIDLTILLSSLLPSVR